MNLFGDNPSSTSSEKSIDALSIFLCLQNPSISTPYAVASNPRPLFLISFHVFRAASGLPFLQTPLNQSSARDNIWGDSSLTHLCIDSKSRIHGTFPDKPIHYAIVGHRSRNKNLFLCELLQHSHSMRYLSCPSLHKPLIRVL
ncbi:hypothetical protein Dimus_000732 [Dionaea muscipula]